MAIMMPEKKQSALARLAGPGGSLLGAGIGTLIAPGAGTMMGAQLGGTAGGAVAGAANKDPAQALQGLAQSAGSIGGIAAQSPSAAPMSPMQRRQAAWDLGGNWRY